MSIAAVSVGISISTICCCKAWNLAKIDALAVVTDPVIRQGISCYALPRLVIPHANAAAESLD